MQKNYKYNKRCSNNLQCGFTMVELLVAMVIGLFLVAGVFQLFVANKQSSRIQNNLSHIQENGRFAINQLSSSIRMTGFKADPTDNVTFATTGGLTGTDAALDELSVSFQAANDGRTVDCLGTTFAAATPATTITNRFYIANDANGISNLYCDQTSTLGGVTATSPLIEDVIDMQITYGVDTNNNGTANYYVNAATVTTGTAGVADWPNVVSIHLSLLLVSREDNVTTAAQTYQFEDAAVTAGDNRLHKVFSITIALRNRLV